MISAESSKLCSNNNDSKSKLNDSDIDIDYNNNSSILHSKKKMNNRKSDANCSNKIDSVSHTAPKASPFVRSRHRN